MITRQQYMENANAPGAWAAYYGQFVTPAILRVVASHIGTAAILASKDEHFNDIPLRRWDQLYTCMVTPQTQELAIQLGETSKGWKISLACAVCIAKCAAGKIRQAGAGGSGMKFVYMVERETPPAMAWIGQSIHLDEAAAKAACQPADRVTPFTVDDPEKTARVVGERLRRRDLGITPTMTKKEVDGILARK